MIPLSYMLKAVNKVIPHSLQKHQYNNHAWTGMATTLRASRPSCHPILLIQTSHIHTHTQSHTQSHKHTHTYKHPR